ncbi:MAG TPA: TrkA family potassium uptake protein [Spirochaetales bacterium]|nr:TrkA family potassium uptake protein [Spirochaetales bacterium]HRY54686.1 TrkA family potassium uptake protein [Spirochaetia bacterium]HRZ63328.1 TrkA family potassium uptake protein [Spirochaetia bacterium]
MRYVLVVGAGKVGFYLAEALLRSGYRVGLVEADPARAAKVAEALGTTVINGDGTELEVLEDAEAGEATYLVAATGRDEVNLALCQMAKHRFRVPFSVARVIDPKSEGIFKRLGVDATISATAIAAQTIENVLPSNGMRLFSLFAGGEVELAELELREASPATGSAVMGLRLPEDCVLIALIRGGSVSFPRGKTLLRAGDRVFALARRGSAEALKAALLGGSA